MKRRRRLSQRVKSVRQHEVVESSGGWRVVDWLIGHELALILGGGVVVALLIAISHTRMFAGPADRMVGVMATLWIVGLFLFTVLLMDDNPKYRKSGAWICAAVGAAAGGAVAWIFSGSLEWVGAGVALGAILGATKPVWLFHFF